MKEVALVFLGGGLGSSLRFVIEKSIHYESDFPLATFLVNVIGCFCVGIVLGWGLEQKDSVLIFRFVVTGILGGFTTFSAFGYQTHRLFFAGEYLMAAFYSMSTVALCLLGTFLGSYFGKFIFQNISKLSQ